MRRAPISLKRIINISVATIFGVAIVVFVVLPLTLEWQMRKLRQRSEREKAELKIVFLQAVADGAVPNGPAATNSFRVSQRHAGDSLYFIEFTNAVGKRAGYSASHMFPTTGTWNFKELAGSNHTFQRGRLTNP